jgi:hypothetical protein
MELKARLPQALSQSSPRISARTDNFSPELIGNSEMSDARCVSVLSSSPKEIELLRRGEPDQG